jgi:hypothetical protein
MTDTKTDTKPDAKVDALFEHLRRLQSQGIWGERDAAFAAAIIELRDRLDALAQFVGCLDKKEEARDEFCFDLSHKVEQLAALFIATSRGADERADESEKVM